ncbi:MAG: hypothetical protein WCG50_18365, partial [Rhodoferax sp.]|uniref:hypothetical protein n=1 Tax=Rhodoferax sp. TaxID=50421 RepID=UPI00301681A7
VECNLNYLQVCPDSGVHFMSSCGSFPLNQWDIERYACPSYTVSAVIPIRLYTVSNLNDAKVAEQLSIS